MASRAIEYVLTLKDQLTAKIKQAEVGMKGLKQATTETQSAFSGLIGMLGIGMTVFKGVEWMKGGVEKFHTAEQAQAKLNATIRTMGNSAQLSKKEYDDLVTTISSKTLFSKSDVQDAERYMATFSNVKGTIYKDAIPAVMDLAAQFGGDVKENAVRLGKALNDPVAGVTALKRIGVSFTDSQKETMKQLVATGKSAEAQKIILAELAKESGNAAEVMARTDPYFKFNKAMGAAQKGVGELIGKMLQSVMPVFEKFATMLKSTINFMKKWSDVLAPLGAGLGVFAGAILVVVVATKLWAGAMGILNAIMAMNPITLIIMGIAALVAVIVVCWNKFEGFRKVVYGLWSVIKDFGGMLKDFVIDRIKGIITGLGAMGKALLSLFKGDFKQAWVEAKEGMVGITGIEAAQKAGARIAKAYKAGVASEEADTAKKSLADAISEKQKKADEDYLAKMKSGGDENMPEQKTGKTGKVGKDTPSANSVRGNAPTTINITINDLVKEFSVVTTTIRESSGEIKDLVARALVDAVNDVNLIGGR